MKRKFRINMLFEVSDEESLNKMLELKSDILSGKLQRELRRGENFKTKVTFEEITKDAN